MVLVVLCYWMALRTQKCYPLIRVLCVSGIWYFEKFSLGEHRWNILFCWKVFIIRISSPSFQQNKHFVRIMLPLIMALLLIFQWDWADTKCHDDFLCFFFFVVVGSWRLATISILRNSHVSNKMPLYFSIFVVTNTDHMDFFHGWLWTR